MLPACFGSFVYGVVATLVMSGLAGLVFGWCFHSRDDAVEAAREAKRKGLHALN